MALPRPPLDPSASIPNNPFFSPQTNYIQGSTGPLIVGAGLLINYATGTILSSGSGGGGIVSVSGTAPIIVTSGSAPNVSIANASTTQRGSVQLFNGVNSTSTALALTANQGKLLQDQINALLLTPGIELAGTLDASTGFVASVTSVGAGKGYTTGAVLPAASAITNNTYVIVTTPGTVTPPAGVATVATQGDWFLVSESAPGSFTWQFLNVGFDAPAATTTVAGIVCLSTNALAQAGTDATTALTPAAAASAYIPKTCITAKGTLITGTAANTPFSLPVGTDGFALVACSTDPSGLCWAPGPSPATPTTLGTLCGCTCLGTAALGSGALGSQTYAGVAYNNVALGCNAANRVTTGFKNIAIGSFALECGTTMTDNIGIGVEALRRNTSGTANIGIGTNALVFNTTGVSNIAIGFQAGQSNVGGSGNILVGSRTAVNVTGLSRSVVIGEAAMVNSTGSSVCNVGVGWSALENVTGNNNTAIGTAAGAFLTTGGNNVAIGYCAQVPFGNQFNQLAIGYNAGCNWLTGDGDKHIRPGAGIRDCANNLGTAGQVLTSTGGAIQWSSAANPIQKTFVPSLAFPNGATTVITFAPDTNNGRAVQFWVTGVKTNDGRAQLRTGTWIRDFGNNIYDVPWGSGSGGLLGIEDPGSGTPGMRIRNNSGANMNLNVAWLPIWS